MKRSDRLAYMKQRFPIIENLTDAVLTCTEEDVRDEMTLMESVREYTRENQTVKELTSDATARK